MKSLKTMTTDEKLEVADIATSGQPLRLIHTESIIKYPDMSSPEKRHLESRVHTNHNITTAKARQAARAAGREINKDKVAVETIHELAHHHEDENLKFIPAEVAA